MKCLLAIRYHLGFRTFSDWVASLPNADSTTPTLLSGTSRHPSNLTVMIRFMACVVLVLGVIAGCVKVQGNQDDPAGDRATIEAALRQWPNDFNAENLVGVCGLFADDVVLVYPGGPDRDRQQFCDRMQTLFDDPAKQFSYDAPDIGEVLVEGDLATVRLMWKLTIRDTSGKVLDTIDENGLDVFRRQPDGSWKIHISHAFSQT
jgi:uncharacterized protein (TIGR02246 family)